MGSVRRCCYRSLLIAVCQESKGFIVKRGTKAQVLELVDESGGDNCVERHNVVDEQQPDLCIPVIQMVSSSVASQIDSIDC